MSDSTCDICDDGFCNEVGVCSRCYPKLQPQLAEANELLVELKPHLSRAEHASPRKLFGDLVDDYLRKYEVK